MDLLAMKLLSLRLVRCLQVVNLLLQLSVLLHLWEVPNNYWLLLYELEYIYYSMVIVTRGVFVCSFGVQRFSARLWPGSLEHLDDIVHPCIRVLASHV
jgi:hypothetical protein